MLTTAHSKIIKSDQTPKINAQDTQEYQDPPHPQDPPDCEDSWYDQDARNALDTKSAGDAGDPRYPRDLWDARELKKEDEMLDNEANILRFSALDRVKAEAEAKERAAKEVSAEIRASVDAEQLERERAEF